MEIIIQPNDVSMKEKHQELLQVQRKLVIPIKLRPLIDMVSFIDTTINFLKTRKGAGIGFIPFREIQNSVAITQHKTLTLQAFRQILFLAPDLYDHKWQNIPSISQSEPVLMIAFDADSSKQFLNHSEISARQDLIRNSVIEHTALIHKEFLQKLQDSEMIDDIFFDPIKIQMWHHKFDPHAMVESIPEAVLKQQPQSLMAHRSQSVKDFLNQTKVKQTLIREALQRVSDKEDEYKANEEISKLEEMKAKYGISTQTLKLIQKKQQAQTKSMDVTREFIGQQSQQAKIDQLNMVLVNISHHFMMQ